MRKTIIKWAIISLLAGTIFSCSGVKKVAESQEKPNEEATQQTEDSAISEEDQKKFEYLFVEGLKEKALGNMQKAIQLFSSCLEIDPNSSASMYELAQIHTANNDFTSASLLLEKAISISPENKWYKILLGQVYQQTRRFAKAVEIYDQLLQDEPENLDFLYRKAILLSNAGEFEEAISTYNKMEEITGVNEQVSVAKQQLYVENEQVEKAFEEIEKLIEFNPEEPRYYGLLADLFQNQGDSVNAMKYYRKIKELDPKNGFVHFSLANYYLQKGDIETSFEETKKGFRSEEVDIQTKMQLYMMLTSNPSQSKLTPKQEEELAEILVKMHPEEHLVYTIRAETFLKQDKLKEARDELLKALEIEKNDYMLWERLLFIDNDLQDWEGLYEHSKEAMNLFPNQPQTYFLHAIACVQLEKFEETVSVSDEGLMYVVDNPQMKGQFIMLKGEALYNMGEMREAFEMFDASVELDPDNHIALNNYAYYLSLAGENLDKAERMSGKVIEMFPDNPTYLDTHAWVLFKKGDYSLAKFYMESAIKNGGAENGTLLEHYGDILIKLNKADEAVKHWKKARELGDASDLIDRKIEEKRYIEE
ncbi:MAG: tetratricopeptide repeat protein [Tangfeifania sp.]